MPRVTSADVAREAGLSRATVSYVLNDTPHQKIPEATRRRVLEAATRLGYAPSPAARALRSGRSDVVLGLLPDWPIGPAASTLLSHLSAALAEEGLTFLVHLRPGRPVAAITPAAVVAFEELDEDEAAALRAAGVEVVVLLFGGPARHRRELQVPNRRIGELQVGQLAAAGHRRIGYALPDDPGLRVFSEPRLEGVRAALAERGLAAPVERTVPLDPAGALAAVVSWRGAGVTAVCAYNDEVGLAVLAGARRLGLRVPAELAVIGVDDIPAAALADPPLSTVVLDQAALAAQVARALTGKPARRGPPPDVRVITRGTT